MTSTSAAGQRSRPGAAGPAARQPVAGTDRQESVRLLDAEGTDGFSLPKLGRALGADPTAVYRHFASKDDLILAIADHLIEEAMTGISPQPCWVDTLADSTRRLRRTYLAHPAAASLSACRTTQRRAEMRIVDIIIGAVLDAGFEGAEAALVYRAFGDFSLAWAGWRGGLPCPGRAFAAVGPGRLDARVPGGGPGGASSYLAGPAGNCPVWTTTPSSRPSCRWSWAASSRGRRAPAAVPATPPRRCPRGRRVRARGRPPPGPCPRAAPGRRVRACARPGSTR